MAGNEWWYLNGLAREVWRVIRSGSVRESVCPGKEEDLRGKAGQEEMDAL